jgi:hypothetical protein
MAIFCIDSSKANPSPLNKIWTSAPGGMNSLFAGGGYEHLKPGLSGLRDFIAKSQMKKGDFSDRGQIFSYERFQAVFVAKTDAKG